MGERARRVGSSPRSPGGFVFRAMHEPKSLKDFLIEHNYLLGTLLINGEPTVCEFTDFDMIREIGRGGFGYVNHLRHKKSNFELAVKFIPDRDSPRSREQLLQDLRVNTTAQNPHIVNSYGVGVHAGNLLIYMELMRLSLDKVIIVGQEKKLTQTPEHVLRHVAYSLVQGLHYLKSKLNILHRDVKPHNVLVGFRGEIKLCDFGIAKTMVHTKTRSVNGCPTYMAPERFATSNEEGYYDVRSDTWSLGLTLHEIGKLQYPYNELIPGKVTEFNVASMIIYGNPPRLHIEDGFSQTATTFVNLCLQKEPDDRPKYDEAPKNNPTGKSLMNHEFIARLDDTVPEEVTRWFDYLLSNKDDANNGDVKCDDKGIGASEEGHQPGSNNPADEEEHHGRTESFVI